jgi:hypothetical protein
VSWGLNFNLENTRGDPVTFKLKKKKKKKILQIYTEQLFFAKPLVDNFLDFGQSWPTHGLSTLS